MNALVVLLFFVLCANSFAQGGIDGVDQLEMRGDPQTVEVVAQRNRLSMPYRGAYDVLKKTRDASEGQVEVYFQAVENIGPKRKKARIWMEGRDAQQFLTIDSDGRFYIPILNESEVDSHELFTNAPSGALSIKLLLRPAMTPENISIEKAKALTTLARRVRSELIPWYARLFVPTVYGVGICYASREDAEFGRSQNFKATPVPLVSELNDLDKAVFCLAIDERAPNVQKFDSERVSELLFIQSRFE